MRIQFDILFRLGSSAEEEILDAGLLIGTSFPIKKYGLIRAQKKSGNVVGQGHAYLKVRSGPCLQRFCVEERR